MHTRATCPATPLTTLEPALCSNDAEPPEVARLKKLKPLSHFDFLEKISEGLFLEGFNSAHIPAEHIDLSTYQLDDLESAIRAKHCVAGQVRRPMKRSRQIFSDEDLLPVNVDKAAHVIRAVPNWVIKRGRSYCALRMCPEAADKASSSSHRHKQAPRAKAGNGVWCMACQQPFHAGCYTVYHRGVTGFDDLNVEAPEPAKQQKTAGGRTQAQRARSAARCSSGSVADVSEGDPSSEEEC